MSRTPRTAAGASMLIALSSKPVPQEMIDLICDIEDQAGRVGRPRDQRVDWDAVEYLVDDAIRRGAITVSRGAEILGIRLRTWLDRALEIRDAGNPLAEACPPEGLDEAWAAAEAALPEGWVFYALERAESDGSWEASASRATGEANRWEFREGAGPTPAAALLALAARLSARGAEPR